MTEQNKKEFKILSIDGGGIRGLGRFLLLIVTNNLFSQSDPVLDGREIGFQNIKGGSFWRKNNALELSCFLFSILSKLLITTLLFCLRIVYGLLMNILSLEPC